MDSFDITSNSIKTTAVSICHFILMVGQINGERFAYLSHFSYEYAPPEYNAETAVVRLLKNLTEDIMMKDKFKTVWKENTFEFTISNVLVGGGVDQGEDLIKKGLLLLNGNISNIQQRLEEETGHLFKELQNKVLVIPPITYLMSDIDEDEGKSLQIIVEFKMRGKLDA